MLRVALIGMGYWGPNLVRNLVALDGVVVSGICDMNPIALKQAKKQYPNVPTYETIQQLFL